MDINIGFVNSLLREDALKVLREVLEASASEDIVFANLLFPSKLPNLSDGWKVSIYSAYNKTSINSIVEKHNLSMTEENGKIVIFQPRKAIA